VPSKNDNKKKIVIAILYRHVLPRGMLKNVLAAVQNGAVPIPNAP
jgi:hypothetical protein